MQYIYNGELLKFIKYRSDKVEEVDTRQKENLNVEF